MPKSFQRDANGNFIRLTFGGENVRRSDAPRSGQTVSGYGARMPLSREVRHNGRWHRVYIAQYANAGSAFISSKDGDFLVEIDGED